MTTASAQASDREAIEKTIQTYVNGVYWGKGDDMEQAFHEGSTIYGYIGNDFFGGPIQGLFDWHDGNGPTADVKSKYRVYRYRGTVATVRP